MAINPENQINEIAAKYIEYISETSKVKKPLVAIHCVTYNHGSYLRDTLEGFVKQQTTFPFVAIVHEDASTDNTAEVLRKYAEKYPDIILPIFETENQHSKGLLGPIMAEARCVTGAKYIAMCEGDDFWTDPLKLQKQVDFLETHSDFSMCFHSANLKYEDNIKRDLILESNYNNLQQREYSIDEIHRSFIVPACSVLFRIEVWNHYKSNTNYFATDNVLWTVCASCGRIFCLSEKMATYRINNSGWVRRNNKNREIRKTTYKKWLLHYIALRNDYPEVNSKQIYNNEINYATFITYTDIEPITNIIHHFLHFLKIYKIKYLKALIVNICLNMSNQIKRKFVTFQ